MANPYNDPRALMARLQNVVPSTSTGSIPLGPTPSKAGISLGRAASTLSIQNPELRSRIEAIAAGNSSGQNKGLMGAVLGNPLAKVALKPLELLALPGKTVVGGLREAVDALDNNPNTVASFSDFRKNVADPTYGFGKAFKANTGNIWADRVIGFIGDVALDPITYATFGAGKAASYGGRLELAGRVLKNTGDEALAKAVAMQGRSALRNVANRAEILDAVGANKFGVYMFGKRIKVGRLGKGLRVPLSGPVGEISEATLSKMRLAITDTRLGKWAQKTTLPKDMLSERIRLAQGVAGPDEAADIIRAIGARPVERAASAVAKQAFINEVQQLLDSESSLGGLEGYRKSLYKFIENPALLDGASEAERRGYTVWKQWLDTHKERQVQGWLELDPNAEIKMVDNYFPRTLSDEGLAYTKGVSKYGESLREIFMDDPFSRPDSFTPRSLAPGKKFFGKTLEEADMNIASLNRIAKEGGFSGEEFFVTDVVEAAKRYASDAADEAGVRARNTHLRDNGFFKKLEEGKIVEQSIDEEAIASARNRVIAARESLDTATVAFQDTASELVGAIRAGGKNIDIESNILDARIKVAEIANSISDAKNKLISLFGDPAGINPSSLSDGFPDTLYPVLAEYDNMAREVRQYEEMIAKFGNEGMNQVGHQYVLAESAIALQDAADAAAKKLQLSQQSISSIMEISNAINTTWERIVQGGTLHSTGEGRELLGKMRDIIAPTSATSAKKQRAAQTRAMGVTGSFEKFVDSPEFKNVLNRINGSAGTELKPTVVKKITPVKFMETMNNALLEETSLYALRHNAAWAIARDMQLYGDNLPPAIQGFYDDLLRSLDEAAQVENYTRSVRKGKKLTSLDDFERRWNPVYDEAVRAQEDINDFNSVLAFASENGDANKAWDFLNERMGRMPGNAYADTIFNEDHVSVIQKAVSLQTGTDNKQIAALYDYIDDPVRYTGKEEPTISDVMASLRRRVDAMQEEMYTPQHDMYTGKLKRGELLGSIDSLSNDDILEQYDRVRAQALGELKTGTVQGITGGIYGGKPMRLSPKVMRLAVNPEAARAELANSLMRYSAISDAVTKFESMAGLLAPHGLVPTEEMWSGILSSTHKTFGTQFQNKMDQLVRAKDVFAEMQNRFSLEIAAAKKAESEIGNVVTSRAPIGATQKRADMLGDIKGTRKLNADAIEAQRVKLQGRIDKAKNSKAFLKKQAEIQKRLDTATEVMNVRGARTAEGRAAKTTRDRIAKELQDLNKQLEDKIAPDQKLLDNLLASAKSEVGDETRRLNQVATETTDMVTMGRLTKEQIREMSTVKSPSQIFENLLNDVLAGPDGEIIREVIGPSMASMLDPIQLRLKQRSLYSSIGKATSAAERASAKERYDQFMMNIVVPWAKGVDPSIKSQPGPALGVLRFKVPSVSKNAIVAEGGPLFANASEGSIQKWFDSLFDHTVERTKRVDGRTILEQVTKDGSLSSKIDLYRKHNSFFLGMNDGYLNPAEFFANPNIPQNTPSSFGIVMSNHAAMLEEAMGRARFGTDNLVDPRTGLKRAATQAEKDAIKAEGLASRQKAVADAFRDPSATPEDLKSLGFTKAMMKQRDEVLAHQNFQATGAYAKAQSDKEIVTFLDTVAAYDFSKFDEGIVIDQRQVPIYAETVANTEAATVADELAGKRKLFDSIKFQQDSERAAIDRKYLVEDFAEGAVRGQFAPGEAPVLSRRYRSIEARNLHKKEIGQWRARSEPRYRSMLADIQNDINELESRGANVVNMVEPGSGGMPAPQTVIGQKLEPVFATMPDGSRITFSKAEWESLFAPYLQPQQIKSLRTDLRQLESNVARLEAEKARLGTNVTRWGKRLAEIDQELLDNAASIKRMQSSIEVSKSSNRNSALAKVRVLVHGHDAQPAMREVVRNGRVVDEVHRFGGDSRGGWTLSTTSYDKKFLKDGLQTVDEQNVNTLLGSKTIMTSKPADEANVDKLLAVASNPTLDYYVGKSEGLINASAFVADTAVGVRRNALTSMWERSPEYATLAREAELAASATMKEYRATVRGLNRSMFNKAAGDARTAANNATMQYDDVHNAMVHSVMQMRSAERRAVEAAGSKIVSTPEGSFYTIAGKTYEIPDVDKMIADPKRYVERYKKRGELFYDLKRKGNVVMLDDMAMDQRAVAVTGALYETINAAGLAGVANMAVKNAGRRTDEIVGLLNAWGQDVRILSDAMTSVRQALEVERASSTRWLEKASKEQLNTQIDIYQMGEELKHLYMFESAPEDVMRHQHNAISTLETRKKQFEMILENAPSNKELQQWKSAKKPEVIERYNEQIRQWMSSTDETLKQLMNADVGPANGKIIASQLKASLAEGRFLAEQINYSRAQSALEASSVPVVVEKVIKPFADGWEKYAKELLETEGLVSAAGSKMNMPSYGINKETADLINNLQRFNDNAMARELGRFIGQYTGFFKAYATLTPGFHVRNAISNTFQMFAAGAEVKNMFEGMKMYRSFGQHLKSGGTMESWLKTVPEATRPQARIAAEVTLGLSGGNVEDAFREFLTLKTNVLTSNPATRASRNFGGRVEGSARFTLAWDSVAKGDDFNAAWNRTKKFLFDYNDPTILDDTVRNIIPFWTWMSRNLPLQLTNQWANPRPYMIYNHFAVNFGAGTGDIPEYMKEQGAINIGGDNYLSPDLPFFKVDQQVQELQDPRRLMSYLNPALRLPIELAGGKKFYNNTDFNDTYSKIDAKHVAFQPLLQALGQVEYNANGEPVMSEKAKYAIQSLLPTMGQAERLFPSSGSSSDKFGLLRWAGAPIRNVDQTAKDRLALAKLREIQKLTAQQKRIDEAR
jgi:hypothetical protein